MIMAQEQGILKAQVILDRAAEVVRDATPCGRSIGAVENDLWQTLLLIGRQLLEAFVAGHGEGDLGPSIDHEGRALRRLAGLHERRYVSVFGELRIPRYVYGNYERQKHEMVPLDALLRLPASHFSYLLQDWSQAFCVQGAFDSARQTVERILGIGESVRALEHMSVSMAAHVESFQASKSTPPAGEEGSIMVLTADGKGVPMRRDPGQDGPTPRERRSKGQKANKKREACVGAVYTIEPFVRTPEDVVNEVHRDEWQSSRPEPQHKEVRAQLTRDTDGVEVTGKERIFGWFATEVEARNPHGRKPVVCLMDGDRALWKKLSMFISVQVVRILDLYHVMERLWKAAHCFYPEGSEEASRFVTERLRRLLCGDVGRVIGGLQQMATKRNLRGSRKKQLQDVTGSLRRNRAYMHYDEYLKAGYPIGSGVAEGTCRHLVKDRMEQTGMHWRVKGAQAMLELRAVYINGEWDRFQQCRIQEEHRRLYPYLRFVQRQSKEAA